MIRLLLCCLLHTARIPGPAGPEKPVTWTFEARRVNAHEVVLLFTATLDPGWHIYSAYQKPGGPVKTSIVFTPSKDFSLQGKLREPKPLTRYSTAFDLPVSYFEGKVSFQQYVTIREKETLVSGELEYMACNELKCLNPEKLPFHIPVKWSCRLQD